MSIRAVTIAGLPEGVEVRRSTRRRASVSYYREQGRTIVVVPERMTRARILAHVDGVVAQIERSRRRTPNSDTALAERAEALRQRYLPAVPRPYAVRWSTRQRRRYGSCNAAIGIIRLSTMLQGMPDYVLDSIVVHELAHLSQADHGPEFAALIAGYPQTELAAEFLRGYEHAQQSVAHAAA